MEEERRNEYDFCPKCGALMQNGQCQSCGYGRRLKAAAEAKGSAYDMPDSKPEKKGMSAGAKAVLVICILLAALAIVFTGIIIFSTVKTISSVSSTSEPAQDFYDYGSSYGYDLYTPDAGDEYYEELTDATTDGLSYQVEWHQETAYPDAADENAYFSLYYPTFSGDNEELLTSINAKVEEMVHRYDSSYTEDGAVVNTVIYVTLMEEDRLSLVCKYEVSGKDDYYGLDALNMDMSTGQEIPYGQLLEVDDTLVTRFRAQNSKQNGSISWLDDMSDDDLLKMLSDDEKRVVFLTPVGTEVGINTDDGWVTVTFKENTL